MKKNKLYLTLLVILTSLPARSQVSISIDSIILDGAVEIKDSDAYISGFGKGPVATIMISITNESSDALIIHQHRDYQLYCEYLYDGTWHKSIDLFLSIDNEERLFSIPKGYSHSETLSTSLFLPCDTVEMDDVVICDHLPKLNEVLSSFRIVFCYKNRKYVSQTRNIIKRGSSFFLEN